MGGFKYMARKRITTTLDIELMKQFRAIAAMESVTFNDLLENCMKKLIDEKRGVLNFK